GRVVRGLRRGPARAAPPQIVRGDRAAAPRGEHRRPAMAAAVAAAGEGRNEREAAAAASRTFLELGADTPRVGVITSGGRAASLHGGLGSHRLERGDLLHMELVPQVHGYSARIMRPTVIDAPSQARIDAARVLVELQ